MSESQAAPQSLLKEVQCEYIVGIPSGRFLPFGFGISTLRVGLRFLPFQLFTRITLCSGVLMICQSMPAVDLPVLVWVIRRTDNSRLA